MPKTASDNVKYGGENMKITFKKLVDREKENELEEEKMREFITLVAHELAIKKRGKKEEGYRYIYFTNPLRHKNNRGNTFIWDLEIKQNFVELKFEYIGKRSSLFRLSNIFEFARIDWQQSSEYELALLYNPSGQWIISPEEPGLKVLKFRLKEYYTSTPQEWGVKWYEEIEPCYEYYQFDFDEDGYYHTNIVDITKVPVISSSLPEEEIRSDVEKCAVITDHLHRKLPRAIVEYKNVYDTENPPWWVEEQLR